MIGPDRLGSLRAAIVGAAREGTALALYLAHFGAQVTLTDTKSAEALMRRPKSAQRLEALKAAGIRLVLGQQRPIDLARVDVLFQSPGVPPSAPIVQAARRQGVPISSEPRLFTQICQAPIVGITGSSGKTTTTALTGEMYALSGRNPWVGGNIGTPLTEKLIGDERPDVVVMELSSFQLELFSPDYQGTTVEVGRSPTSRIIDLEGWSPHIAAITNVTPNHLDRHKSMDEYAQAKSNIVMYQHDRDWAVLNEDDARSAIMATMTPAQIQKFSLEKPVDRGAFLQDGTLILRWGGREHALCHTRELRLRGAHNVANVLTAACCAIAGGASVEAIRSVATSFSGVPHRLEAVREWRGATFVNDSIATSPERAMAALRSYTEPLILLAGGRDKHLPWGDWAKLVVARARAVVTFGEAQSIIEDALRSVAGSNLPMELIRADSLERAVGMAASICQPGDVVLMSPGGTSFDAFGDFEERGIRFRGLVCALE